MSEIEGFPYSLAGGYDEKLEDKLRKQREERGFDDTELWNLDITIAKFIAPRLRVFINQSEELSETSDDYILDLLRLRNALEDYADDPEPDVQRKALELIEDILPRVFASLWT